jgi:Glycosyl transferases group 1
MKLMFVYWAWPDQGSGNVIQAYTEAAKAIGHEVVVYGPPNSRIPLNYSMDMASADATVFIFEWTTQLQHGDHLDLVRLMAGVPRSRRVIIDGDGNYNDLIRIDGDYNHKDVAARDRWIDFCDSLSDKIYQPTLHPLRSNVGSFLFYAYNPAWEAPLRPTDKDYTMAYIGHAKFRWRPMLQVLEAIEPVRDRIGRIQLVGVGWDQLPWWARQMDIADYYVSDAEYLKRLRVEVSQPVPFAEVVGRMGNALFNPVLVRPLFRHLQFVTPRVFETLAANTIPLFGLDETHVREIYGEAAVELVLMPDDVQEKILDIIDRPHHYAEIVGRIRRELSARHSHTARLLELIDILESDGASHASSAEASIRCG